MPGFGTICGGCGKSQCVCDLSTKSFWVTLALTILAGLILTGLFGKYEVNNNGSKMKVYVLISEIDYSPSSVLGAYSTKEKAEHEMKIAVEHLKGKYKYSIDEIELDKSVMN